MVGLAGETVLSRRARPQPKPFLYAHGDCGGCSLGGALGLEVAEVYRVFEVSAITNSHEMARLLRCSVSEGYADRMIDTPAKWNCYTGCNSFGHPAHFDYCAWFNYIRMGIDAGYYGLATVDYAAGGGPETNHWVLICGARTEGAVSGKTITGEILISCSVRGEQWIEARDFLLKYGGYDTLLVRPK